MICTIDGKVIDIKRGTNKKGEAYAYPVVYDGESVYRIFGVDCESLLVGSEYTFPLRVRVNEHGEMICSFLK